MLETSRVLAWSVVDDVFDRRHLLGLFGLGVASVLAGCSANTARTGGVGGGPAAPTPTPSPSLTSPPTPVAAAGITPYPPISGLTTSSVYKVSAGSSEQQIWVEQVTAGRTVHCAAFAGSGAITMRVEVGDPITSVQVSPENLGVAATVDGSSARFTLPQPAKVIVFVATAAGALDPLYLLVDEPEVDPPTSSTPNVQYFAAGTHDAGEITLADGEMVYLAAGALVTGRVTAEGAKNITINGRGILRGPDDSDSVIRLRECTGVIVDGISMRNPFGVWTCLFDGCANVAARNLNVFSFAENGDGIDPVSCTNVTIDRCLISTGDDCIAIKSMGANVANIEVSRTVLETYPSTGSDEGGDGVKIGTESDCADISGIHIHDCDVVRCYGANSYGGSAALSILPKGDTVHVHDVEYNNIRIESRVQHTDFQIRLLGSGTVSDVTLTDVTWNAARAINLVGPVTNVTFAGCAVGGKPLIAAQVKASDGAATPVV
jgi:hypothetical protein